MIESEREALPRPWLERQLEMLAKVSRPLRRRLSPNRFKETYVNRAVLNSRDRATLYVEIGVRDGESFRLVRADRRIGIDPERRPSMAILESGEEFFETTSDEFFDLHADAVLRGATVDVALLDGLHEFRQVLRDFDNLERFMRPDGVVIVDDCNPQSAERASDVPIGGAWNGDVWKLVAYLVAERPDLRVTTIDADEGVGVITGFGRPGADIDEATVEYYKSLPYGHLEADRTRIINLRPPSSFDSLLPGSG